MGFSMWAKWPVSAASHPAFHAIAMPAAASPPGGRAPTSAGSASTAPWPQSGRWNAGRARRRSDRLPDPSRRRCRDASGTRSRERPARPSGRTSHQDPSLPWKRSRSGGRRGLTPIGTHAVQQPRTCGSIGCRLPPQRRPVEPGRPGRQAEILPSFILCQWIASISSWWPVGTTHRRQQGGCDRRPPGCLDHHGDGLAGDARADAHESERLGMLRHSRGCGTRHHRVLRHRPITPYRMPPIVPELGKGRPGRQDFPCDATCCLR